jgi:hypothetical protein
MLMPLNFLYLVTYSLIPTFHHWIYILLEDNIAVRTSVSNSCRTWRRQIYVENQTSVSNSCRTWRRQIYEKNQILKTSAES